MFWSDDGIGGPSMGHYAHDRGHRDGPGRAADLAVSALERWPWPSSSISCLARYLAWSLCAFIAPFQHDSSVGMSMLAGAVFGLVVYLFNFYVMTRVFPWFVDARGWLHADRAPGFRHGHRALLLEAGEPRRIALDSWRVCASPHDGAAMSPCSDLSPRTESLFHLRDLRIPRGTASAWRRVDMAIAIALVVIVVASVLFHFVSPWWATPLASNWKQMDDTLTITLVIAGFFFIVINLFIGYIVWRYRHRTGHRAAYQPENREAGAMADRSHGHRHHRDAGAGADRLRRLRAAAARRDGGGGGRPAVAVGVSLSRQERELSGTSDARFVSASNPLGINPDDPRGQDNIIVVGPEVHLPLNRPVKVLLALERRAARLLRPAHPRAHEHGAGHGHLVLVHADAGWRFDILCAQLCGVGHYNMRGHMVVEDQASFDALARQAADLCDDDGQDRPPMAAAPRARRQRPRRDHGGLRYRPHRTGPRAGAEQGLAWRADSVDGKPAVGPTWKGSTAARRDIRRR